MKFFSELEMLSMLCNIKSLTSRCLAGGGHRWISVSQSIVKMKWKRSRQNGTKAVLFNIKVDDYFELL